MIEINTNRVHETVRLHAGNDTLILDINIDPLVIMGGIGDFYKELNETKPDDKDGILRCAMHMSELLFGKEQAAKCLEFYGNDGRAALNATTKIFSEAIMPKLTAAQESAGRKSIRKKLWAMLGRKAK